MPRDAEEVRGISLCRYDSPREEDNDHRADGDRQITVHIPDTNLAEDCNQCAEEGREESVDRPGHTIHLTIVCALSSPRSIVTNALPSAAPWNFPSPPQVL